jgi:hypothetical protein
MTIGPLRDFCAFYAHKSAKTIDREAARVTVKLNRFGTKHLPWV